MTQQVTFALDKFSDTFFESITKFLRKNAFVDVTLICKGESISAHRLLLSACSALCEKLLVGKSVSKIIFPNISKKEMIPIIHLLYKGKVIVPKRLVSSFIKTSKELQLRGVKYEETVNTLVKGNSIESISESTISVSSEEVKTDDTIRKQQKENTDKRAISSKDSTKRNTKQTPCIKKEDDVDLPQNVPFIKSEPEVLTIVSDAAKSQAELQTDPKPTGTLHWDLVKSLPSKNRKERPELYKTLKQPIACTSSPVCSSSTLGSSSHTSLSDYSLFVRHLRVKKRKCTPNVKSQKRPDRSVKEQKLSLAPSTSKGHIKPSSNTCSKKAPSKFPQSMKIKTEPIDENGKEKENNKFPGFEQSFKRFKGLKEDTDVKMRIQAFDFKNQSREGNDHPSEAAEPENISIMSIRRKTRASSSFSNRNNSVPKPSTSKNVGDI